MRDNWPWLIPLLFFLLGTREILKHLRMWQTDVRDLFRMSPEDQVRRFVEHLLDELNSRNREQLALHEVVQGRGLYDFSVHDEHGDRVLGLQVFPGGSFTTTRYDTFAKQGFNDISPLLEHFEELLREYHRHHTMVRYQHYHAVVA
ncbi:MAG: hypothetical protein WC783_01920 [Candidatus Paceibacterota bacterium]